MFKKIFVFLVMLAIIAALTAVAFTGVDLVIFNIPSVQDGVVLGLDLKGGSIITYEADQENPSAADMDTAIAMLRQRIGSLGYTEAQLYKFSDKRIRVEIPDLADPAEAEKKIGSTAQLEFRTVGGGDGGEDDYIIWLTGDAVESASAGFGPVKQGALSEHYVTLTFNAEARSTWTEATKFAAQQEDGKNYIAIYMDGAEVFAPRVGAEFAATGIDDDSCLVTFGSGSADTAKYFADLIKIGRLPFSLITAQLSNVGPTLGAEALNTSLMAGAIGIGLIILFMLIYYRLPGLIASITLLLYTALLCLTMAVMGVNLSLPGIAGIILSIGMAIDANVVIFERVKEELRSGKTVRSAVDAGFKRALTAIIDSNITTMIAGFVLLSFGTGPIQGFATTLLVGVIVSMITTLIVTQLLLRQMAALGVTKLGLYGVREDRGEPRLQTLQFSIVKKFKTFGIPSLLIFLFAVSCLILPLFGVNILNFDIDFSGGTSFHLETGVNLSADDLDGIAAAVRDVTGQEPSAPQKVGDTQVIIKTADLSPDTREAVFNRIKGDYPALNRDDSQIESVSPSVGSDLRRAAIMSVIVAAILMLIYITIRFQFSSGLAAVVCLIHDISIVLAGYAIFQIPINMNFIAVMLTIFGYSLNATIIVFDRVRENRRLMQKSSFLDVIDRGIKQTLARNINTTLTTLFPVICIILLGVPSVRNFALPLTIGLLAGSYSSVCLSGSLWYHVSSADKKATKKLEKKA